MGENDKAISDFNKAIEINPSFAHAYTARGTVHQRMGQLTKACADWEKACELKNCEKIKSAKDQGLCK